MNKLRPSKVLKMSGIYGHAIGLERITNLMTTQQEVGAAVAVEVPITRIAMAEEAEAEVATQVKHLRQATMHRCNRMEAPAEETGVSWKAS